MYFGVNFRGPVRILDLLRLCSGIFTSVMVNSGKYERMIKYERVMLKA